MVHSHLSYADLVAAAAVPRRVALVTTEHGIAADDRVYHGSAAKSAVMARAHTLRLRRFDAVIAVSNATKRAMADKWHPRQRSGDPQRRRPAADAPRSRDRGCGS